MPLKSKMPPTGKRKRLNLSNKHNLINRKYKRLLVLEFAGYNGVHRLWKCVCDCGNFVVTSTGYLNKGTKGSCGCLSTETRKGAKKTLRKNEQATMVNCHNQHKNRCRAVELTPFNKEDYLKICVQPCYYCGGFDLRNKYYSKSARRGNAPAISDDDLVLYDVKMNGVDRMDSSIGYTIENSVSCCKRCNFMKSNLGYQEFIDKIKQIYNHLKKQKCLSLK